MQQAHLIRAYTPHDKPALLALLRLNTPPYFSPDEEKDLIFYLDHEIEQYFVVEQSGIIIGCGGINFADEGSTGKLSWDIFHPQYHGKGAGRALVEYRINTLRALPQVKKISVRTSQLAYKFYEKCGFKLLEIQKDYWAKGFDLYNMQLQEAVF